MDQAIFLQKVEDVIPSNSTLVAELSDLLDISMDSSYRRIRNETQLTIREVSVICKHFNISFDAFNNQDLATVTFNYVKHKPDMASFEHYLRDQIKDLQLIQASKEKHIVYACEDVPIFYNYNYPLLGAFKMFYWMKSILNAKELEDLKFSPDCLPTELIELGKEIYKAYTQIPSTEIWTDSTYSSAIKQIHYYWESGRFERDEDAIAVLEELKQELNGIQKQAELGLKYMGSPENELTSSEYNLYLSDIEIGNNCVLVKLGHTKLVYIGHMSYSTIATSNVNYAEESEVWLNAIMKKASLVSKVSEKTRYQFFKKAMSEVDAVINEIKGDRG